MIDNDYVTPHLFLKKNIIILCSGSSDKRQLTSWRQTSFCVYFHLCILNRTSVFKFQISQCPNSLLMSCFGQNIILLKILPICFLKALMMLCGHQNKLCVGSMESQFTPILICRVTYNM